MRMSHDSYMAKRMFSFSSSKLVLAYIYEDSLLTSVSVEFQKIQIEQTIRNYENNRNTNGICNYLQVKVESQDRKCIDID